MELIDLNIWFGWWLRWNELYIFSLSDLSDKFREKDIYIKENLEHISKLKPK